MSLSALIDRWLAPPPDPVKVGWIGEHVFAHRGLHGDGIVENSRTAFQAAIEAGFGIECDIQRSRDGWPMVFHDWTLERLVGRSEETESLTTAELKAVQFVGVSEGPLALSDLLELVAGRVPILVEIKSRHRYDVERSCAQVHAALQGYRGQHAVMSFDPRVSRWFSRHAPQAVRGLVVTEETSRGAAGDLRRRLATWHARPDFLAYDIRDLPSRFAGGQRSRGLPVATWTVRTAEQRALATQFADAPIAEGTGLEAAA